MAVRAVLLRLEAKIGVKYRLIWQVRGSYLARARQYGGDRRVSKALGMGELGGDEFRGCTMPDMS